MPRPCDDGQLYLGPTLDPASLEPSGDMQCYDPDRLTTHGVIVGMTGSGKTGLGIILLEEAMRQGIPTIILDPKGDMGNLGLRFPALEPADFEPWVAPEAARREGLEVGAYAARQAETWRAGLAGSGLDGTDLSALRDAAQVTIFTPGSGAGVSLNIVGSLQAPDLDPEDHAEVLADEVEGFVSGLLQLADIQADPISSREHILLSNLVLHSWRQGRDLTLGQLIAQVQRPPLRKLGVFDLESFFPEKERMDLALRLNGLLASPSFQAWMQGPALEIDSLLRDPQGRPRASVIAMAHLTEAERQFVVTLVLGKLVTWMQTQPGTSELRAMVYMDEVYGFAPPTAEPPSKKPILTLLKQARAFGVGLVLSTQNPVDLDYKAISNAGTWFIGRLQTERDRARLLDGLTSRGDMDRGALDDLVASLDKRQFLLQRAGQPPAVFGTRWAMSYLRGPLTRSELKRLGTVEGVTTAWDGPAAASASPTSADAPATGFVPAAPPTALADDESAQPPIVARNVKVAWLAPSAAWADEVGATARGLRYRAALAARVRLRFDERYSGVDHDVEWEAVWFPLEERFDPDAAIQVDHDPRDFEDQGPDGAVYVVPDAPIGNSSFFSDIEREIRDDLYRDEEIRVFKSPELKLYSRVGESKEDFLRRADAVAQEEADAEAAELRDKYEDKARRVQERVRKAERRVAELDDEVGSRSRDEWVSIGADVLKTFLGGRSRTRSIVGGLRRASTRRRMTDSAANRLETAAEKVDALEAEMRILEDELIQELAAIDEEWAKKAQEIEEIPIGLEKNDIHVDELVVVWLPTEGE